MKAIHFLPPAAALLLVLAWNAIEATSLQQVGSEAATLKQAIADARAGTGRAEARARKPQEIRNARDGGIDSPDPVDAGRGETDAMLFEALLEKDPSQALNRFADRIGDDDDAVGWQLALAMTEWAKRDSTAAAAWLDQQIASGAFEARSLDGHSHARIEFEGALVAEMLSTHNPAAAARISMLPENQRREVLEQISFSQLGPEAMQAYTQMVREWVPVDERDASFTHMASDLVRSSGFSAVGRFLDLVEAVPGERAVAAREAANARLEEIAIDRPVTHKDVDEMRSWVERQTPGNADGVTGEALGAAAQGGGESDFAAVAELVLDYHRGSSGDDVLLAFLESFAARSHPQQSMELAQHIRDAARRKEIMEELE